MNTKLFDSRQDKTIFLMIRIYCNHHHKTKQSLCLACGDLFTYAQQRLRKCPFGEHKPICAQCTIHCYKHEKREEMKKVMRFAGPRISFLHPYYAIMHVWDKYSGKPQNKE